MRIKIREKTTGRTGSIDDSEFDPNRFEIIGAQESHPIGEAVVRMGKDIAAPFVRTARNIAGTPVALAASTFEKGRTTPGPLEQAARKILPQETIENPQAAQNRAVKDAIIMASYGIPFGKGANLATKALIPGAAVGVAQDIGKERGQITLPSLVESGLLGAGTAGVLEGASKAFSGLKKVGPKIEETGAVVRRKVAPIRVRGSVYGAGQEKAIQKTLDELGIVGTPEAKYAKLEPAMAELGNQIQVELTNNPQTVLRKDLINQFESNLKASLRRKELTSPQATKEIAGYLKDLGALDNEIATTDLFKLKKLVNEDYQAVVKKIASKTPLNPRDRVIEQARKTLDDLITEVHPEVKRMTMAQSHLYDAAESLNRLRRTTPTTRVAGTTMPSFVFQGGGDIAGAGLQRAGRTVSEATLPSISPTFAGQVTSRLLPAGYEKAQADKGQQIDLELNKTNHILPSIPPQGRMSSLTGYSADVLAKAMTQALLAGDSGAYTQLKKLYDLETSGQKKPTSAVGLQVQGKAQAGLAALSEIKQQINSNPNVIALAAIPGSPGARQYEAAVSSLTDAIGGLRTGASVSKQQQQFYRSLLPKIGDSPDTIDYKLGALETELNSYLQGSAGVQDQLPSITQTQ